MTRQRLDLISCDLRSENENINSENFADAAHIPDYVPYTANKIDSQVKNAQEVARDKKFSSFKSSENGNMFTHVMDDNFL